MAKDPQDIQVIVCNYRTGTSECAKGALAFVRYAYWGMGAERVNLLVRSRSGRFIEKIEAMWRLESFRYKTLPPQHPLYNRLKEVTYREETLEGLRSVNSYEIARREHLDATHPVLRRVPRTSIDSPPLRRIRNYIERSGKGNIQTEAQVET